MNINIKNLPARYVKYLTMALNQGFKNPEIVGGEPGQEFCGELIRAITAAQEKDVSLAKYDFNV